MFKGLIVIFQSQKKFTDTTNCTDLALAEELTALKNGVCPARLAVYGYDSTNDVFPKVAVGFQKTTKDPVYSTSNPTDHTWAIRNGGAPDFYVSQSKGILTQDARIPLLRCKFSQRAKVNGSDPEEWYTMSPYYWYAVNTCNPTTLVGYQQWLGYYVQEWQWYAVFYGGETQPVDATVIGYVMNPAKEPTLRDATKYIVDPNVTAAMAQKSKDCDASGYGMYYSDRSQYCQTYEYYRYAGYGGHPTNSYAWYTP